jgi:deoxyadenosine/deoxycytidine kinase
MSFTTKKDEKCITPPFERKNHIKKVILEGNIGAGKTTILNTINTSFNKQFEPVEEFTLLASFYSDPVKYAMPLQLQVVEVHLEKESKIAQSTIFERTVETSIHIFASMLHDDRIISSSQVNELNEYLKHSYMVSGFIYVDVDVEKCMERIKQRGREGEDKITRQYLEKLKSKIDQMYAHYTAMGIPCLRVENKDDELDGNITSIENFLENMNN